MDRPVSKHTPQAPQPPSSRRTPAAGGSHASEIQDGLVLALLARKRLLVLIGDAGSGRGAVYRQLVEHVASDGAMVLPVTATVGAEVEDLILAASQGALPGADIGGNGGEDGDEPDFDALIAALEERLDLAGTGLLAVENAGLLAPPVLADLMDLTRSETPAGRFLQVLLCGTPDLERTLTRAGLSDSVRELGVIYRMGPNAVPSTTPMEQAPVEIVRPKAAKPASVKPTPIKPSTLAPPPILAAPEPAPMEPPRRVHQPANDWKGGYDWSDRGPAINDVGIPNGIPGDGPHGEHIPHPALQPPPRRAALYAGAALTTLVLLAAAGAAVVTSVPGLLPDSSVAVVERGWTDARGFVERNLNGLLGTRPAIGERDGDALALGTLRAAQAETAPNNPTPVAPPPPQPPSHAVQAPAHPPVQIAALPPPAATPPAAPPAAAPLAPLPPATPPVATKPLPAPPTAPATNSEAAPGTAALPPLEEPRADTGALTAPPAFDGDVGQAQRTRALVEQARRQIAGKRLTTPPGDNALETVQRLRQTAPAAPEAIELLAVMEDTYRRWATMAERDGDWNEARRFYERAAMVSPENPELRERVKAAGERRTLGAPPATPAPSTVAPGLQSREAVLALLRNPTELTRALQSGVGPDTRLDNGKTLLMIAAEQGLIDAARILLERHARTDLRTSDGATAVMYAAWGGYEGVVAALADGGAELDATNDDGKTALMAAAARGHTAVVQALVQRGVMVDRTTANGWSALMYAANNGHDRVATLLLGHGANPYRMDTNGNSALTLGALQGHVQVVEALKPR